MLRLKHSPSPLRVLVLLLVALARAGDSPLNDGIARYQEGRYDEATEILRRCVAAEPGNSTACHCLGLALMQKGGMSGLREAIPWLQKAAQLAPDNADYQADFGGAALQLAAADSSIWHAVRGRDAMERAVRIDPSDLDTRQALFEFYTKAPWPLGSRGKALEHVAEIAKTEPDRAAALEARLKADAREFEAAFRICADLLEKNPADYLALHELGRCAALSGREADRGLTALRKALALVRPSPAAPSHADLWRLIARIEEGCGRRQQAKDAYGKALALEPEDEDAVAALRRLR